MGDGDPEAPSSGGASAGGGSPDGPGSGGTPSLGGAAAGGSGAVGGASDALVFPSDLIPELEHFKLTLPVDENGEDSSDRSSVDERNTDAHEELELEGFEWKPYFYALDGEVHFMARADGATTSGSKYPRSELRQLVGGDDGYWSFSKPQSLTTELSILHLPVEKPEVSVVQIHGPSEEPLRVQLRGGLGVYIVWSEDNEDTENAVPYELGEKLRIQVDVEDGDIHTSILNLDTGGSYEKTWTPEDDTGYFKVGCYLQSSMFLSEFKDGYENEAKDAYGLVAVSRIELLETYP